MSCSLYRLDKHHEIDVCVSNHVLFTIQVLSVKKQQLAQEVLYKQHIRSADINRNKKQA